jgi:hypothetical protein
VRLPFVSAQISTNCQHCDMFFDLSLDILLRLCSVVSKTADRNDLIEHDIRDHGFSLLPQHKRT